MVVTRSAPLKGIGSHLYSMYEAETRLRKYVFQCDTKRMQRKRLYIDEALGM